MRGRAINYEIDGGRSDTIVIKPLIDGGEEWRLAGLTAIGELRTVKDDETVGSLDCRVTLDNEVVVDFPEMESGQYIFVVDLYGEDGGSTRLIEGYVTWLEPKAVLGGQTETEKSTLLVHVDGKRRRCVWAWSSESEQMYLKAKESAEKAAESAEKAAESAKSVNEDVRVELLEDVQTQLETFDSKVRDAIVVNKATNTWKIGGVVTDTPVTGESGKSPQISTHGTWLRWDEKLQQWVDTGTKASAQDGKSPYISDSGYWMTWDASKGVYVNSGVKALGEDGVDARSIQRHIVASYEDIPQSGATCTGGHYYYVENGDSYDVYAWFESLGWVNVPLAGEIAKANTYGLVKLGTSLVIDGGASVGMRADGGMAVGEASTEDVGVMKYSSLENTNEGGKVHKGTDGAAYVDLAGADKAGAVQLSYPDTVDTACIGLTADKRISVVKAGENTYGVVKAGKYMQHVASEPYLLESGTIAEGDKEGQHAINLMESGALKFMGVNTGTDGWNVDTAPGVDTDTLNTSVKFLGLQTSESFSQQGGKLSLNPAQEYTLGGVCVVDSWYSPISGIWPCVPSVQALQTAMESTTGWISDEFATKTDTYTKEEVDNAVEAAYADFKARLMEELFKVVTEDEYAALTPEPGVLYLTTEQ